MVARKSQSLSNPSEHHDDDQASPKRRGASKGKQNTVATVEERTTTMTELSIIEYSEDLGNAEAPVPLPMGDYPAEIRAVERKTSAKGNEYISVTFHISPDSYPADYTEGSEDGAVLSYQRLSPEETTRARYGMKKFAEAIGAPMGAKIDLNDWVGLSAIVSVTHETYEGETRATIKKVNPA